MRHYPEQNKVLGDLLASITTPTQIVAGASDDLVPWSNNQYLADLLPNSEIHPLDAGHFAWEEYGRLVAEWISGGYRRVTGWPVPGRALVQRPEYGQARSRTPNLRGPT